MIIIKQIKLNQPLWAQNHKLALKPIRIHPAS